MIDAPETIDPTAPEYIYLQVSGDSPEPASYAEVSSSGEVTWCADKIYPTDIKYRRNDAPPPKLDAPDRPGNWLESRPGIRCAVIHTVPEQALAAFSEAIKYLYEADTVWTYLGQPDKEKA